MTERFLQGMCDVSGLGEVRTSWDGGCGQFEEKHRQVSASHRFDRSMPPPCLKVCGNCAFFTVAEFEIYPEQIVGEGMVIGRAA